MKTPCDTESKVSACIQGCAYMPHQRHLATGGLEAGRSVTEVSKSTKCGFKAVPNHQQCFKDTKVSVTATDPEDLAERQ